MSDLISDWRSWTNQQEIESALAFPGMNAFTDVEIISNLTPATLAITGVTNVGTTVTATVAATSYSFGSETQNLQVGQTISVTGITGFTTNNPNGTWVVTAVTATTVQYVVTNAPTGSYSSGGTIQPSEVFAAGTLGTVSVPTYANTPATVNAVDPFSGWTSQDALPASSFGSDFPLTVSNVTWASGVATITVGSTGALRASATNPQYVTISGVVGATGVNGTFAVATVPSGTTFTIAVASNPGTYSSGGSVTEGFTERPAVTGLT